MTIDLSAPAPGIHPTATIVSGPDAGEALRVLCGGSSGCTNGTVTVQNNGRPGTDIVEFAYTNILRQTNSSRQSITWKASDVTPPVTSATLSGRADSNNWYVGAVTLKLAAIDPIGVSDSLVSGVASTGYRADGGASCQMYNPNSPPIFGKDGTNTISFRSQDNGGTRKPSKTSTSGSIKQRRPSPAQRRRPCCGHPIRS